MASPNFEEIKEQAEHAFTRALRYLSFRARSEKEIFEYLSKKKHDPLIIQQVIKRLKEKKFLDDTEFAKLWIEQRQMLKGKSKFVIKQELIAKGVAKEIIDDVLEKFSQTDLEAAKNLFEKKKRRFSHYVGREYEKKVSEFLQRKGFSWDIVKKILQGKD